MMDNLLKPPTAGQAQKNAPGKKKRFRLSIKSRRNGSKMTITAHISELRNRLIICVLCFLAAFGLSFSRAGRFVAEITNRAAGYQFIYISPAELFLTYIKMSFITAAAVSGPVILYHLWRFIRPGLEDKEKNALAGALTAGLLLFVTGVWFSYMAVLPVTLQFFLGLNAGGSILAMISIQEYISYVVNILLAFGVAFEMPIVLVTITYFELVTPTFLQKNFKYAVLVVLIVAAALTPPDMASQLLLTIPMLALFEASILISRVFLHKKLAARLAGERGERHSEAPSAVQ